MFEKLHRKYIIIHFETKKIKMIFLSTNDIYYETVLNLYIIVGGGHFFFSHEFMGQCLTDCTWHITVRGWRPLTLSQWRSQCVGKGIDPGGFLIFKTFTCIFL